MPVYQRAIGGLAVALTLASFAVEAQTSAAAPAPDRMTTPGAQQSPVRPSRPETPGEPASQATRQNNGDGQAERRVRQPEEKISVTRHTASVGGQTIAYTATAASYIIRADDGTPKATFFFVGYTKDNTPDPARRPISFVFSGGPAQHRCSLIWAWVRAMWF